MHETTLRLTSPALGGDKYVLRKQTGEVVDASFSYAPSDSTLQISTETAGYYKLIVFYSKMGTTRTYNVWIGEELNDGGIDYSGVGGSLSGDAPGSVQIGEGARAENDFDFVLGTESHNVKVPGTLSVQEPTEPQHAATKGYVDYVAAGGGTWVSGIRFTRPATLSSEDYVKLWLANPGGISLIEVAAELPAGSAGEEYEFTLDWDALSPHETKALEYLGGQGVSILPGIDNVSKEARPVVFWLSGNAFLTSHLEHGGITVYGTVLIPSFGVRGEGAEAE